MKILKNNKNSNPTCNCRVKNNRPVDDKCIYKKNVIYKARYHLGTNSCSTSDPLVLYTKFNEHKVSFPHKTRNINTKNYTDLAKYLWKLNSEKKSNTKCSIKFFTVLKYLQTL